MNSLQRSVVTKTGYDHGWEVAVEDAVAGKVTLTSAHHRTEAAVRLNPASPGWLIQLPSGRLPDELARVEGIEMAASACFLARTERDLGQLLDHAARLARTLPDLPCQQFEQAVAQELSSLSGPTAATEVERMVRQRVGQQVYRQSLMDYWGGACAVTGIAIPELLRASHARPWAECRTDEERLNVFNGFLLAAHLDALFDRHLMTFSETGEAVFAPSLTLEVRQKFALSDDLRLRWISPNHMPFLREHRMQFDSLQMGVNHSST